VVVLIGYYIRTKVTDAPIFVAAQQEVERVKAVSYGVIEVLKRYPRGVFTAMGLRFAENIMYYLVVTFSIVYLKKQVGADTSDILWWLLAAHAVHFVVIPQVGRLSDKVGRRPVYIAGAIAAGTWGFFAFPMMNSANYLIIMSAIIIGLVIHAFMYAPQPAIMAEMFPTRMRYSGVSLGYQVTSIVAGSVAPAIATWLLDKYHSSVPIALYLAGAAVVTLVAALFMRETKGYRPGQCRPGRPRGARQGGSRMTGPEWSLRAGHRRCERYRRGVVPASSRRAARRSRSPTSMMSPPRAWPPTSADKPGRWTFSTSRRWRICSSRPTSWLTTPVCRASTRSSTSRPSGSGRC